ncbi:hypothetical protein GCM10028801_29850 [Nocardioides maradonensis]
MVQRTPGPFQYYDERYAKGSTVTGDTIRALVDDPATDAATIANLADDLHHDVGTTTAAVEGSIRADVSAPPRKLADTARTLSTNATFAIGVVQQFAGHVDQFDTTVDGLNQDVATAVSQQRQSYINTQLSDHGLDPKDGLSQLMVGPLYASQFDEKTATGNAAAGLQGRYDKAVSTLDSQAADTGQKFRQGATAKNVLELLDAGYLAPASALRFPGVQVAPEDVYHYYRSRMDRGEIPDFSSMTESQRVQFVHDNPDVVTYLMSVKNPGQQVISDVVALVLPHVDATTAKEDAGWIVNHDNADGVLDGFRNSDAINAALASLAPWMAKNGITSIGSTVTAQGANAYLKQLAADTWPHHDDIEKYINGDHGFSDSEKQHLLTSFADSYLNLSNEKYGGGYADLPDDLRKAADQLPPTKESIATSGYGASVTTLMGSNDDFKDLARLLAHGDVEAGTDLSKHLGSTVVTSNSMWDHYNQQYGNGKLGSWDDGLSGDVLDLVSRNHQATADLLSGKDVPPTYYGNVDPTTGKLAPGDDVLAGYYGSDFGAELFGHNWDAGSEAKVAHMVDWIHGSYQQGGTEQQLANQAFNGLAADLTNTKDDTYKNLMGSDGESAAHNNHLLALGLTDALSDHLGQLGAQPGTSQAAGLSLSQADQVRLMTLLASDHDTGDHQSASNRLAAYVAAYEHDRIASWVHDPGSVGPRELAAANGQLSGMLDSALMNEASERGLNANDAAAARLQELKIASGIVSTLAGKIPVVGNIAGPAAGIGNTLLANLVTAPHLPSPPAGVDPAWNADGSHVTTLNSQYLVDALVQQGKIDRADLPPALQNPSEQSNAAVQDAADQTLTSYFTEHPIKDQHGNVIADKSFYDDYAGYMTGVYTNINNWYGLDHKDSNQVKEFLTSSTWGRP